MCHHSFLSNIIHSSFHILYITTSLLETLFALIDLYIRTRSMYLFVWLEWYLFFYDSCWRIVAWWNHFQRDVFNDYYFLFISIDLNKATYFEYEITHQFVNSLFLVSNTFTSKIHMNISYAMIKELKMFMFPKMYFLAFQQVIIFVSW